MKVYIQIGNPIRESDKYEHYDSGLKKVGVRSPSDKKKKKMSAKVNDKKLRIHYFKVL